MSFKKIPSVFIYFFLCTVISVTGCKKKHPSIYGNVTVDGRITDKISGDPIPNSIVSISPLTLVSDDLGGTTPVVRGVAAVDTTDANGNYHFDIVSQGVYEFEVNAAADDLHVETSSEKNGNNIQTAGAHVVNLPCDRSAKLKITITNTTPRDTAYALTFDCLNNVTLYNFYKDTVVYIKIRGGLENQNVVELENANISRDFVNVAAARWDTASIGFNY